ncbi:O-methylsterigmatocystin oxidoreductase [Rhizoctonia solani]|uniref:O-methylsterigmatocystin oxidoreductase n=1 Tax=Rhizoctonia solani TaxID=456999 RepID=A0A0K6G0L1_9AGAM|nr:O-methylsterigmatocystin oxidoreductase [Rhizoctonia solani]
MAGSTILMAVCGYDVTSAEDRLFQAVETAVEGFSQALVVPNYLVNTFHWLEYVPEWIPGAEWKIKANAWRLQVDRMLHVPFEWTKNKMSTGAFPPCLLSEWLTKYTSHDLGLPTDEVEGRIRDAAGTMFAAGTDTSVSTIRTFIMAMAIHQDVQAKAQAMIDDAIGKRLPEMADWEALPYVQRIIKEVLRWRLVLPLAALLALPHACIEDDIYRGYRIPKGAIVIGNAWAMSNDPSVYSDPDCFNPDRFLDPTVPDAPALGFGRRICPGAHHGEAILFITTASMLSMFDIRPEVDAAGKPIPLKADMELNKALRQVVPFRCRITPRSKDHEQIVREWIDS